jgi:hypothetical protein
MTEETENSSPPLAFARPKDDAVIQNVTLQADNGGTYVLGPPPEPVVVELQGLSTMGMTGRLSASGSASGVGAASGVGSSIASAIGNTAGVMNASEAPDQANMAGYVAPPIRTVIIRTVLSNQVAVQFAARSFVAMLELKIESLRAEGSNSEITEFADLKHRVGEFLGANEKGAETPIVNTTLSIADGLRRFWTEKHVSICEKTLNVALFCAAAGVLAIPTAVGICHAGA